MKDKIEMRQLPRISVSFSRKVNLGNYESADIFVSLADDNGDIETLLTKCQEVVDRKVKDLLKEGGNETN